MKQRQIEEKKNNRSDTRPFSLEQSPHIKREN